MATLGQAPRLDKARQRPPGWAVVALAAVLLVVVGTLALTGLGGGGCEGKNGAAIAADPAVQPALDALARRFNGEGHEVAGGCAEIVANAVPSAGTAMALGGDKAAGQTKMDAYVLDSSLWLAVAARAAERTGTPVPKPVGSVASSPLVLAQRQTIPAPSGAVSWAALRPGAAGAPLGLRLIDPERDASGQAALLMARRVAGTGDKALAGFTGIMQGARTGERDKVAADPRSAFAGLARDNSRGAVLAVSEQALWQHRRSGGAQVTAALPADGTMNLDFPMVVPAGRGAAVARLFQEWVGKHGAAELAKVGLRTAGGAPASGVSTVTGITGAAPPAGGQDPRVLLEVLEMWHRMGLGTRMLTLIDVSGSMLEQVPGTGRTRMSVTAGEVDRGMALLPDDAEVGVWAFSTGMNGPRPYRELAPVRRLGTVQGPDTHRSSLQQTLGGLKAKPDGDTGLNDSVLAAFRAVKAGYRDDMVNVVLVLTDGRDDFKGGTSEQALLAALRQEFDPAKPVQVIGLAFGPGVDLPALQRMSKATGGAAYQVRDPREIRELFRRSAALKVCDDPGKCPTG